jgi:hypothetical protein
MLAALLLPFLLLFQVATPGQTPAPRPSETPQPQARPTPDPRDEPPIVSKH